jgi:ribose transport system substrate-binding protein
MAQPTIAVFTKNRLNPGYRAARLGADRTAARFGAKTLHFVPEQPDHVEQQIALIEQALEQRPAAFVFVPVHATAVDEAIREVNAAGIPVFNLINRLRHSEDYVTFVGADDRQLGAKISDYLFHAMAGRGNVVILEGTSGSVSSQDRIKSYIETAHSYPGIHVVGSSVGNFLEADGKRAMQRMLAEHSQIDGVLAANDSMALGALEALKESGRHSLVVGVNAIEEAISAIISGKLLATADFDTMKMGCLATNAAIRFLRGMPVPKEITLPVQIVDAGNCAAWDGPIETRECPSWDIVDGTAQRP